MKNKSILTTIAALAFGLLVTSAFAGNFNASHVTTYVGHDGAYGIWSGQGSGSVVGNYSVAVKVKVMGSRAEGVQTITTANGDTLVIAFAQTLVDKGASVYSGTFTITGGTGRFTNATGGGTITSSPNSDGTRTATFNGTISL
jgi:hypothetical protein